MTPIVIPFERLQRNRLRILKILHPVVGHRFLPSRWIEHELKPVEHAHFVRTLRNLRRKPNQYIYWPEQQGYSLNANYKDGVHGLTEKGAKAVGIPMPILNKQEYAHELGVALVECSMKFGARETGVPFKMGEPQKYKLPSGLYVPDGHPIVIGTTLIPGIEFERRKYNENAEDTNDKIEKIIEFMSERLYEREGFKSSLIPIISTTEQRTETLKRYVERKLTKCPFILFKTTSDWATAERFPDPNGEMLTVPWERVGFPPLSLQEANKGGATYKS